MNSFKGHYRFNILPGLALIIFLFVNHHNVHANPLPESVGEQLSQQLENDGVDAAEVQLNIRIPITGNPAGTDTHLWATAVIKNDGIKRPTLLVATAYRRELMSIIYVNSFVKHDYNVVIVDMRGTGSSEGVWGAMDPIEQYDVAHIIDRWIPAQPWSDGKIGMVGGSYMAILQYSVSGLVETSYNPETGKVEPTHLKAIAPLSSFSDAYRDIAVHGGNFNMEFMSVWIGITDLLSVFPPNVFTDGFNTATMAELEYAANLWQQHINQLSVPIEWLRDPDNIVKSPWYEAKSPFIYWPRKPQGGWQLGDAAPPDLGNHTIPENLPVFNSAGWFDIFTRGTLNNYQYGLENHQTGDKTLIIGPWYHVDAAIMLPGIDGIGISRNGQINHDILVRWFDWKIKGVDDPFMEAFPVLTYVLGEERWRAEKSWPLPASRTTEKHYFLSKDNAPLNLLDWFSSSNYSNNYKLVENISGSDYYNYFLWFKSAKANPVLQHNPPKLHGVTSRSAQRWFGFSPLVLITQISKYMLGADLDPLVPWEDERFDEVGALTFTTEPLKEDVEIVGPLKLTFWAKTRFNQPLSQQQVDETIAKIKQERNIADGENLYVELMDRRDVQWVVELNDVFANGRARNVTSGWLSAWNRPYNPIDPKQLDPNYTAFDPFYDHANKNPAPIEEGVVYPYVVELWPTNNVFKKGHRIRVSISASDIPHLLPFLRPSENTLVIDHQHPAQLDFTVANKNNEGTTWKWVDNVSEYLMRHRN